MRTKLFFCALLLGACTLSVSAQNVTLSPEAGISMLRRPPYGEDWRPSAKVGISADFNLTKHFSIESGLFYTFRHYKIDDGGIYSNEDARWVETVSRTRHFLQLPVLAKFHWQVNKDTKVFFGVGPYIGVCLKTKLDGNQRLIEGTFPNTMQQYYDGFVYGEDEWGNSNLFLYDKDNKFDWGVAANIGVEVRNWYTKLQYDLSLGKENKGDAIGANYHTLTLSAGYKFHL